MTDTGEIVVDDRNTIDRLIAVHSQFGCHWSLPLFRAARDGLLCLVALGDPCVAIEQRHFDRASKNGRPVVLLLQEDDGLAVGPEGWRCAVRARWWARSLIIHAAAGEARHYELAVATALLSGRLLMVETDSAHGPAWDRFVMAREPKIPSLHIHATGGVHPVRASVQ